MHKQKSKDFGAEISLLAHLFALHPQKPHLSERETWIRRASAARFIRSLAAQTAFRREMCSASRCYSSIYHEHPQRRRNLGSIKKLASLVESRGEAFHDALILLQIGEK